MAFTCKKIRNGMTTGSAVMLARQLIGSSLISNEQIGRLATIIRKNVYLEPQLPVDKSSGRYLKRLVVYLRQFDKS